MPNLASIIWAVFLYLHNAFNVSGIPMPVVIQTGNVYKLDVTYSAITVPLNWKGNCTDQKAIVMYMSKYYNSFLRGKQVRTENQLQAIENGWVCVE